MAGRVVGYLPGGRWGGEQAGYAGMRFGYNFRSAQARATRVLSHSVLGAVLYPVIPTETTHFGWQLMPRRDLATQKTLTSTVHSVWPGYVDDIVLKEIFEPDGGLSVPWSFILQLHEMYLSPPDWLSGETLVWRPRDRNELTYPVDIVNLIIDAEEFKLDWKGEDPAILLSVLKQQVDGTGTAGTTQGKNICTAKKVEIHMRIRPEVAPNASVFLIEGSVTNEVNQFELE